MLDKRFVETTQVLEIARNSYRIPLNSNDYITLDPLETYYGSLHNVQVCHNTLIKVPVAIQPDARLYEIHFYIASSQTFKNFDINFLPNNITYFTPYTTSSIMSNANTGAYSICHTVRGIVFYSDIQMGSSDTAPVHIYIRCMPNPVNNKCALISAGDIHGLSTTFIWWHDTSTKWTKLGALQFPGTVPSLQCPILDITCFVQRIV